MTENKGCYVHRYKAEVTVSHIIVLFTLDKAISDATSVKIGYCLCHCVRLANMSTQE